MFFPSPARWQQRLEPRVSWHLMFQASEGPQLHPDRSTPDPSISRHRGQRPWTSPPSSTRSHLLSQPGALEKRAALCPVGKQRGGTQTHLRMSGIGEYRDCVCVPSPSHPLLQTTQVTCVFFSGQRQVGQSERDTTCEAEGGRVGGGNAEDAAEEAGPPPCGGGGLFLIDTYTTHYVL